MGMFTRTVLAAAAAASVASCASGDGNAPFADEYLLQPVAGAARGVDPDFWRSGKICDITKAPYHAVGDGSTNCTAAIQAAIDDCGDIADGLGGTVLVPTNSGSFVTGSLWLRSNLTLRVEANATLIYPNLSIDASPIAYVRRECVMMDAHAGFLNAGRCLEKKDPLVGWDDCAKWSTVENLVIEGDGTLDANGDFWWNGTVPASESGRSRPMMLDLMWVDGLTIRDLNIRRPGFWTVHPTYCNNVRVTGLDIETFGHNTDGIDPDSSWNVYIGHNTISTGDDCIAVKSGRDWSGRMVNISTENVLAEANIFERGHGVSIGSETSGWIRNVTFRDSSVNGTDSAVRIKSCIPRGGGVEHVTYQNMSGSVSQAVQLTLNYGQNSKSTATADNSSVIPAIRHVHIQDMVINAGDFLLCDGLGDSLIDNITMVRPILACVAFTNMIL